MKRRNFLAATLVTSIATTVLAKTTTTKDDKKGFIVRSGEARHGQHTPFGKNPTDTKISTKDTNGMFSVFEFIGKEKVGPPLHLHFDQDEVFYVVEGEYLFQIDKEQSIAKAGDTVFLPRNVPHTWYQMTDYGKLIYLLQPSGKFEEFFHKFSLMKALPPMDEMQKFYIAHGMKIMGPPLSVK